MGALVNRNRELIFDPDYRLSDADFRVMKGTVQLDFPKPDDIQSLLRGIEAPVDAAPDRDHPAALLEQLRQHEHYRQFAAILARVGRGSVQNRDHVVDTDLGDLLKQMPDPVAFERGFAHIFLINIQAGTGREKRAEYEKVIPEFERIVYGDRYALWEQFRLLFDENIQHDPLWNVRVGVEMAREHPDDTVEPRGPSFSPK